MVDCSIFDSQLFGRQLMVHCNHSMAAILWHYNGLRVLSYMYIKKYTFVSGTGLQIWRPIPLQTKTGKASFHFWGFTCPDFD